MWPPALQYVLRKINFEIVKNYNLSAKSTTKLAE